MKVGERVSERGRVCEMEVCTLHSNIVGQAGTPKLISFRYDACNNDPDRAAAAMRVMSDGHDL